MLVAGEEPLYLLRRLTRAAVEDIGLADPQALVQCLAAKDCYDFLGSPEGELAIVQACLYLATAPKSNAAYMAQKAAWRSARETGSLMPPKNILNAPTKLMKDIGYGKGYAYDHDADEGFSGRGLLARGDGAADLLRADRPRLRSAGEGAAGILGTSGARSCNKRTTTRVKPRERTGSERHVQIDQRLLAGPAHELGTKILIAILILVATWIVARAVKWVLQKAIDRMPALRKHMSPARPTRPSATSSAPSPS